MTEQNFLGSDYSQVEPTKVLLDPTTGEIQDINDPFNKIKVASKLMNITIKDPDKKCKKCYGKGYVGIKVESKEPVPCLCIFEKNAQQMNFPIKYNREQKRKLKRQEQKILTKLRK